MSDEKQQQRSGRREVIQTKRHRVVYANTFGISASDNDIIISFGILSETLGQDTSQIFNEVTVALTHRSAKVFVQSLLSAVEKIEKNQGPIKTPALDLEPTEIKIAPPVDSPEQ